MIRIPLPSFYFDSTDDDKLIVVDGLTGILNEDEQKVISNPD
jgi:hypothetical protein